MLAWVPATFPITDTFRKLSSSESPLTLLWWMRQWRHKQEVRCTTVPGAELRRCGLLPSVEVPPGAHDVFTVENSQRSHVLINHVFPRRIRCRYLLLLIFILFFEILVSSDFMKKRENCCSESTSWEDYYIRNICTHKSVRTHTHKGQAIIMPDMLISPPGWTHKSRCEARPSGHKVMWLVITLLSSLSCWSSASGNKR